MKMPTKNAFKLGLSLLLLLFVPACATSNLPKTAKNVDEPRISPCKEICKNMLPEGSRYLGEFQDGLPSGKGQLVWENGSHYEGEFLAGKLHGEGILLAKNGDRYTGDFIEDKLEGQGIFSFINGSRYTGSFKGNEFYGHGILTKANGDEYVGEFRNNHFHGKGILYFKDDQGQKRLLAGSWNQGRYDLKQEGINEAEHDEHLSAEVVLFYQYQMLSQVVEQIAPSRPEITDLYFLSFGGDGRQDVFMKEALYTKTLFDTQYGLKNRSLLLANHPKVVHDIPIASVMNLKVALEIFAQQMDVEEDILFLYLTSHGSQDHTLSVRLGDVPLADLPAETLAKMLKDSKIKWKVIAISACYSGGFIEHLKDDYSMIITSARSDRSSFGCGDDSEMTYFGRAFFEHALDRSTSFADAFLKAKDIVTAWEDRDHFEHSEPQIYRSELIEAKLKEWRMTLDQRVAADISQ